MIQLQPQKLLLVHSKNSDCHRNSQFKVIAITALAFNLPDASGPTEQTVMLASKDCKKPFDYSSYYQYLRLKLSYFNC